MEQKEKSRQTIDYIINCAIKEFSDTENLISLNEVCLKHNISKGKLYHHFSSKDELLCACACYVFDCMKKNIDSFRLNQTLSIAKNFHNYYSEQIRHFIENPDQLIVLRLSYLLSKKVFSEESLNKIEKHRLDWKNSKKNMLLQILHSNNTMLRVDDNTICEILLLMYENTFQVLENKMISAKKNNDLTSAEKYAEELIEYHDTIINSLLYGVLTNE